MAIMMRDTKFQLARMVWAAEMLKLKNQQENKLVRLPTHFVREEHLRGPDGPFLYAPPSSDAAEVWIGVTAEDAKAYLSHVWLPSYCLGLGLMVTHDGANKGGDQ